VVNTLPEKSWKNFIYQRIRWASKATSYKERNIFFVLLLVYLFNLYIVVLGLAAIFYPRLFFSGLPYLPEKLFASCPLCMMLQNFIKENNCSGGFR